MQPKARILRPGFPYRIVRYAAREYLLSFLVSFAFFFAVFFVNQILLIAEDVLSRRAPLGEVMLLLLYFIPSIVAISAPFASLAGALMASGRLGADNEMLAMAACSVRTRTVFMPFAVLGLVIALLSFVANDIFLPLGTIESGKLYRKLINDTASVELQPWSVRKYGKITIVTGPKEANGLGDIIIFDGADPAGGRIISAKFARLDLLTDGFDAILHMEDVMEQRRNPKEAKRFSITRSETLEYRIAIKQRVAGIAGTGPAEMSSVDLAALIQRRQTDFTKQLAAKVAETHESYETLSQRYRQAAQATAEDVRRALSAYQALKAQKPEDKSLDLYRMEYNKKFAIPAAAFIFAFLAFPLGLGARRAGRSVGFGLGLLIAVLYWAMLFAGQTLGYRLNINPIAAIWTPNIVIGVLALFVWLYRRFVTRGVL